MKTLRMTPAVVAVLIAAMFSGCNIYKKFELPTQESELINEYSQSLEQAEDTSAYGNLDWREVFTDPMLQDLINKALENNVNLEQARLNVEIAQSQLKGAKLSYLPAVSFGPNGAMSHYHIAGADWSKSYQLPLSVSWEVDVFGKILNSKRGAQEALYRSQAYHQAVRSQIIAGVASCYYTIATLEAQLQLMTRTEVNWQESVEIMKNLKEAGRVTEAAVVQSQAQLASIRAQKTDVEAGLVQSNNAMSLLLKTMPQRWAVSADATLTLPVEMEHGIPMRQLASRPDVAAAEHSLAAAYYATNSARAAFYPSFNISSNGGFTNALGSMIVNPGKWFIQLAATMTAPIFMRGQRIAALEAAKAQQQQAMLGFEQTILSAAAEVSNALSAYELNVRKREYLAEQSRNMALAVDYTQELLSMGVYNTTYLEVINAQQSLLSSEMAELSSRQDAASAIINLYQSLGGGRK